MRNIQSLAIEMFRVRRNTSTPIMNDIFKHKGNSQYNLRQSSGFTRPLVKSVYHGSESASLLGPKLWDILPNNYNDIDNLNTFKNKFKKWKPENSPCRLCKVYIDNIDFVLEQKRNLEYSVALGEVHLLPANLLTFLFFYF